MWAVVLLGVSHNQMSQHTKIHEGAQYKYFHEHRLLSAFAVWTFENSGTVKRHNVCERHVAIETGVKQTERDTSTWPSFSSKKGLLKSFGKAVLPQ